MQKIILVIAFFASSLTSINLYASDSIPAGNVSGRWIMANSPYRIYGNITVPKDSLLEIDSGVVMQFQGHYQLLVRGRIHAIGTQANLILFTALADWWGIRFDGIQASQDSSLFMSCKIEKCNANGSGNYSNGGAFFIANFSKIRVQNCILSDNTASNGGAFYCDHADPIIIGNTFNNNTVSSAYGGGIYCWYASPLILSNTMTYNMSSICCKYSSPIISGNTITHNTVNCTIDCEYSNPLIINNIISYGVMGIYIHQSSPEVIGNEITNHSGWDYGAGIRCRFNSSPLIANNTIANNSANIHGGGLSIDYSSSPTVRNTILWGNFAPNNHGTQLALDQSSFPTFFNCDIQGGSAAFYYYDAPNSFSGTYVNSFDSDPEFVNASNNNFALLPTSPCIDAGDTSGVNLPASDLSNGARICNTIIDIGAYEICPVGIQEFNLNKIAIQIYPNPASDYVTVKSAAIISMAELKIINALGELEFSDHIAASEITLDVSTLSHGVYFLEIIGKGSMGRQMFIKK